MKLCDIYLGLPHNSEGEVSAYNAVEPGSSPGLGRSSGELEEVMAIHTSILAWRISWSEDHGRLQSMGLQRVSHDWAIKTTKYYYTLQRSFPGGSAVKNPPEMHEMWIWSLSWEDPGVKNDNSYWSGFLALEIWRTVEPGSLQSMRSQELDTTYHHYTLQNYHHNKYSNYSSPYKVTTFF